MGPGREVLVRRLLAVAAWVLATLAAGTVAWGAVSRLGNEGAVNAGDPLSGAQVREALQRHPGGVAPMAQTPSRSTGSETSDVAGRATGPHGGPTASPGRAGSWTGVPTSRSSPATTRETRSWQLVGGTVGAVCRGTTIDLLYAVPRDGWAQSVEQNGPTNVVIAFARGGASSRLVAACVDGSPAAQAGTGYVQGTSGSGPTDGADRAEPESGE